LLYLIGNVFLSIIASQPSSVNPIVHQPITCSSDLRSLVNRSGMRNAQLIGTAGNGQHRCLTTTTSVQNPSELKIYQETPFSGGARLDAVNKAYQLANRLTSFPPAPSARSVVCPLCVQGASVGNNMIVRLARRPLGKEEGLTGIVVWV